VDENNGWAVGDGQGIARTSDGGETWSLAVAPSVTANTYHAIAVVDATTAIAVGDAGTARRLTTTALANKTTPGGANALWGVAFSDSLHGWAVGDSATFLKTTNGGTTWAPVAVPPAAQGTLASPRAVAFADSLSGVIVGQYQAVWRTFDGGTTWVVEPLQDPSMVDIAMTETGVDFVPGTSDAPVAVERAMGTASDPKNLTTGDKAVAYLGSWTDRTPPPPVAPTAPTGVSIAAGDPAPNIDVTWTDTSSDEGGFVVQRAAGSASGPYSTVATLGANVTSWTDTGADLASTWFYRVKSYRDDLSSTYAVSSGLKLDTTAPVTTSNRVASYVGTATITLSATDANGSGIARTLYVVDGGVEREGMSVSVTTPGSHTLEFWSEDFAGNVEARNSVDFTITAPDTTRPTTTSNAQSSYVGGANITLTAADDVAVAHTYYRLDGATQIEGTAIMVSTTGPHTLEFWSVDSSGNIESPHKTASFEITPLVVDNTAPVTTSDAVESYVGSARIALSAYDAVGVQVTHYQLDGGPVLSGSSVDVSALGAHTLVFWSVDWAENIESPNTAHFTITAPPYVDDVDPVTTATIQSSYAGTATIVLSPTDNIGVAHTYYILDGGLQAEGTSVIVPPSSVPTHTLEYWSEDAAGNEEVHRHATFTVTAAPQAPVVTTISLKASTTSTRLNRYVTLSSALKGGVPAGSLVRFSVRLPGKSSYATLSSKIKVSATGASSYRYKLTRRGTYYFQARFLGVAGFKSSISKAIKVVVR